MNRSKLSLVALSLILPLSLSLALAASARAQGADSRFSDFAPSGDWILVIDGVEKPKAKIYDSQRAGALLVRSADLDSPVLIDIAGRSVATLDLLKVYERPDGAVDLLADAVLAPAGTFDVVDRTSARFTLAGHEVVLKPHPWLLGAHNGVEVLDSSIGYQWRAKRYEPNAEAIAHLRKLKVKGDVRVLTFFGSWCPHCKEHLPLLLKTEQRLAGSKIHFDYYGLPSGFVGEPEATKWDVSGVPTAIVLVDGKEVGRIPNASWSSPEMALDVILNGVS